MNDARHHVLDRDEVFDVARRDLDVEALLERQHDVDQCQPARPEILEQAGCRNDSGAVDLETPGEELSNRARRDRHRRAVASRHRHRPLRSTSWTTLRAPPKENRMLPGRVISTRRVATTLVPTHARHARRSDHTLSDVGTRDATNFLVRSVSSRPQQSSSPWKRTRDLRSPVHVPPRVLVAEDDPEMLRLIVEALRIDGYEVQEARDGGRLLVQLTHGLRCDYEQVDLIVSDVRMPVCTGIQVIEALRAAHCFVPVVLMTAFGDQQTRGQAELLGAVLFDKPFAMADLRATVADLLAGEAPAPSDASAS